jgi:anti-anti-sigma regulatory factor
MKDLLKKGSYTTFDLSGVEKIDVSALQVLLSYKRSLQEESKFSVCKAGKEIKKIIKLTGFAKQLKYVG